MLLWYKLYNFVANELQFHNKLKWCIIYATKTLMDNLKVHESRQIKFNDGRQTDNRMKNFDANKGIREGRSVGVIAVMQSGIDIVLV